MICISVRIQIWEMFILLIAQQLRMLQSVARLTITNARV